MNRYFESIGPRFWAVLIAGLAVVFVALWLSLHHHIRGQAETLEALTAEYAALQEESADLAERLEYTYTDEYIEREARSKLGLVREGDTLFQSSGANEDN